MDGFSLWRTAMEKAKDQFKGLLLEFYKRQISQNRPDLRLYDNILFGHYDGLTIRQVDSWYEFSPHLINMHNTNSGKAHTVTENYPVKLLYPEKDLIEKCNKLGYYNYNCWSEPSAILNKNEPCPLFAILLVNFTREYVYDSYKEQGFKVKNLILYMYELMANLTNCTPSDLQIGLFQAIGYYDCAILFRTNKWDYVFEIINNLKKKKYKGFNIISNTYFIPGLISLRNDNSGLSVKDIINRNTIRCSSKCRISISFKLKENTSPELFFKRLQRKADLLERKDGFNPIDDADLFQSCGNIDCMMLYKGESLSQILREFLSKGILTPDESGFFEENIINIRTSISYEILDVDSENNNTFLQQSGYDVLRFDNSQKALDDNNRKAVSSMRKAINNYAEFAKRNKLSMRQIAALKQMIYFYENLTHTSHTFDIKSLMIPVWNMLSDNINNTIKVCDIKDVMAVDTCTCPNNTNLTDNATPIFEQTIQSMVESIEEFRVIVGSFLQTLSYSDSFFIERLRSNYPAVGSATKLLFAYNRILMQVIKEFGNYNDRNDYKYVCLITCGGCDETVANNLSEYVPIYLKADNNRHIEEKRIIVIQLSERSVYDSSGTLFRCIHELWHYCGNRHRRERYQYLVDSISILRSQQLIDELVRMDEIWEAIFTDNNEFKSMSEQMKNEFRTVLNDIWIQKSNELKIKWADIFKKYLELSFDMIIARWDLEPKKDFVFYGKNVYDAIGATEYFLYYNSNQYLEDLIISRSESEDNPLIREFISSLSDEYNTCKAGIFGRLSDRLIEKGFENLYYKADSLRQFHQRNGKDSSLTNDIYFLYYLSQQMGELIKQSGSLPKKNEQNKYETTGRITTLLSVSNYEISKRTFHDVFGEIYSDYMTCKTLEPSFSEYIYSFLYENNDLDVAMPNTVIHCMRLGIVIHKYFLNCSDEKNDIEMLLSELDNIPISDYRASSQVDNDLGQYSRFTVNDLKEKILLLWSAYWKYYSFGIITPFIDYLTECDDNFPEAGSNNKRNSVLRNIRAFYQDTRIDDSEECVQRYFDAIIKQWSLLAEGDNN